ncbi:CLUMA_CG019727, isoform A [Clunio marinus]|uniref:CLUMA_CG019727, isoform A n=1 Tax=Clunio marinus TaxID=568069 RepID=A0A1J1J449_9DIPT|nr:CLUMA_CG019727, isoform A [Clunio marinus]
MQKLVDCEEYKKLSETNINPSGKQVFAPQHFFVQEQIGNQIVPEQSKGPEQKTEQKKVEQALLESKLKFNPYQHRFLTY